MFSYLQLITMEDHLSVILSVLVLSICSGDVMAKLSTSFTVAPLGWTGEPYCRGSTIHCHSSKRVTAINLSFKSLSGSFPFNMSQLSNLKTLDLRGNSLSGALPSFANLSSLEHIFLDSNDFTSVPSNFLQGLTSLKTLSMSNNTKLSPWQIPTYLSQSSSLETFYASNSSIFGSIPDFFDSLPNLKNLRLSFNNITGVLPKSFEGSGIQNLWLNNQVNGLSGTVDVLSSMPQLSQVWLQANAFSGPVPDLSNCTNLFDLRLSDNHFTGAVPQTLTSLHQLVVLDVSNNNLSGQLPKFKPAVKFNSDIGKNK